MRRQDTRRLAGWLLVFLGALLLVQNLGLFGPFRDLVWTTLFIVGGAAFLGVAVRDEGRWWAFIPGCALLALGVVAALETLVPPFTRQWGGTLFLVGFSFGFWLLYLLRRHWWALIPGGALATLGVIAGVDPLVSDEVAGSILFFGFAATFALVALLPPAEPRRTWALIPMAATALLGTLALTSTMPLFAIFWPLVLVLGGLVVLYQAMRRGDEQEQPKTFDDTILPKSH